MWNIGLNTFFKLNEPMISFITKSFVGIMTLCVAIAANDISEKRQKEIYLRLLHISTLEKLINLINKTIVKLMCWKIPKG